MDQKEIQSYGGYTIGPIHDVMDHSRKTRELWFASYFFSWFMEKLIENLAGNPKVTFLVPYVKSSFVENRSQAGMYHDRFVIRSEELGKEKLFDMIAGASEKTFNAFVSIIDRSIGSKYMTSPAKSIDDVKSILSGYIQRKFITLDPKLILDGQNPIAVVYKYLDSMEEQRLFDFGRADTACFRCKTLPAVAVAATWERESGDQKPSERHLCPLCYIKYFCQTNVDVLKKLESEKGDFRYPPVLDFAAADLLSRIRAFPEMESLDPDAQKSYVKIFHENEDDYDFGDISNIINKINKTNVAINHRATEIKPFHKYLAILQADGDNLGKLAGTDSLSEYLFGFAQDADAIIREYGGAPIFVGGDDILAFLPVAFADGDTMKTVLDCAIKLSETYQKRVPLVTSAGARATLSVGISVSYYKFPLSAALKIAGEELFGVAKGKPGKNTLALCLTKHSGHRTGFSFPLGSPDATSEIILFNKFMKDLLAGLFDLPYGIHHNLHRWKKVLAGVRNEDGLRAFFANNFNESVHAGAFAAGIDRVRDFFLQTVDPGASEKLRLQRAEDALAKLRFVKFMRGDK